MSTAPKYSTTVRNNGDFNTVVGVVGADDVRVSSSDESPGASIGPNSGDRRTALRGCAIGGGNACAGAGAAGEDGPICHMTCFGEVGERAGMVVDMWGHWQSQLLQESASRKRAT